MGGRIRYKICTHSKIRIQFFSLAETGVFFTGWKRGVEITKKSLMGYIFTASKKTLQWYIQLRCFFIVRESLRM